MLRRCFAVCPELYLWLRGRGVEFALLSTFAGCLICIVAGSGAWVSAGDQRIFVGFCADVEYLIEQFSGLAANQAMLVVAFAHHFFYPCASVLLVSRVMALMCSSQQLLLLRAKGMNVLARYVKAMLIAVAMTGLYSVVLSLLAYAPSIYMHAAEPGPFVTRLIFFLVVDVSFTIVCFSACLIANTRVVSNVLLLTLTYASLILTMTQPGALNPSHMAFWMHAGGFGGPDLFVEGVLYSVSIACMAAVLARLAVSCRSKAS